MVKDTCLRLLLLDHWKIRHSLARKSSLNLHRKSSSSELRRPICGKQDGGSKYGLYFCDQREKENGSMYLYAWFGSEEKLGFRANFGIN